jgi:hypothetical protein
MVQGSFMSQCDLQAVRDRDANAPSTTLLFGNKSPRALRDASDSDGSFSLVAISLIGSRGYESSPVPDIPRTSRCESGAVAEHAAAELTAAVSDGLPRSWLGLQFEIGSAYAMVAESNFF